MRKQSSCARFVARRIALHRIVRSAANSSSVFVIQQGGDECSGRSIKILYSNDFAPAIEPTTAGLLRGGWQQSTILSPWTQPLAAEMIWYRVDAVTICCCYDMLLDDDGSVVESKRRSTTARKRRFFLAPGASILAPGNQEAEEERLEIDRVVAGRTQPLTTYPLFQSLDDIIGMLLLAIVVNCYCVDRQQQQ
jgi:hypothetical protein